MLSKITSKSVCIVFIVNCQQVNKLLSFKRNNICIVNGVSIKLRDRRCYFRTFHIDSIVNLPDFNLVTFFDFS